MIPQLIRELFAAGSFDELCRQSVVLGRQILGCQRVGLWFRRPDSMAVTGSFGIDEEGNIRDERACLLPVGQHSAMGRVLSNQQAFLVSRDCPLRNDKGQVIGKGTHMIAALWAGGRVTGCLCADNLLDQKDFLEEDLNVLCMYAATIGSLTFGKRLEGELEKSRKEKEILLHEIHHRVKNNLQVISSLLSLQFSQIRELPVAELFRKSQNRVRAMARVYDVFSPDGDLARINVREYIAGILADLLQSYQVDASAVVFRWEGNSGDTLGLTQLIPCGLIVNELVTNALKHGIEPDQSVRKHCQGEIFIAVQRRGPDISLSVGNNGAPFPASVDITHPCSVGLQLINSLVAQLDGAITLDQTRGTRFTVTFPVSPVEPS